MVRKEKVMAADAPKAEITANPIGPQLVQTPAPAPIIEPKSPEPIFLALALRVWILYTAILSTKPINPDTMMINAKLR